MFAMGWASDCSPKPSILAFRAWRANSVWLLLWCCSATPTSVSDTTPSVCVCLYSVALVHPTGAIYLALRC